MKLKLAMLGVGDVAQRDYLPELHRLADRMSLVAVCGQRAERAQAVGEQYGVRPFNSFEQMLNEADFDALVNLTPIQVHFETTLAALRAGKHVYSEKPLASHPNDAQGVAQAAAERNLKLVCAPCVMLFPQVRLAQQLLAEGVLGQVVGARAHANGGVPPWEGYGSDPTPFFARGGGPGIDMGVYPLHALTGLLGPVRRVSAFTARTREQFVVTEGAFAGTHIPLQVDDNWQLLLDFGGACLATVHANFCVQDSRAPQLEIFGADGTLALNLLDVSAPVELFRPGAGWESQAVSRTGREAGPDHLLGIEHLLDCIEHEAQPILSAAHAIHVLAILQGAEWSAQNASAATVESDF